MEFAVDTREISKKYGDFYALDGATLSVAQGDVFALLGPNGAGKTTLMRILTTQIQPNGGEAFVFGKNVVKQGSEVRRFVGYVPQEMSVWTDISGYENLLIYSKIYGLKKEVAQEAIKEVLALMELTNVANNLVRTYSGGMIRKLELASAIMIKPKILFLDEPTIGLDPATRKTIWEKLKKLSKGEGTTIFFTTHYMDEAEIYADNIGIINKGKMVAEASPDKLRESIGDEHLDITLESPINQRQLEEMRKIKDITHVKSEGDKLKVSIKTTNFSVNDLLKFFVAKKIAVKSFSTYKPTIDDVFLRYVGTKSEQIQRIGDIRKNRERIKGR